LTNCIGTIGAFAIVAAYAALQMRVWSSGEVRYSAANAIGSGLILVSLIFDPNWPSIFIEGFWLAISLGGLLRNFLRVIRKNI
jgi:hypothetical protein